LPKKESRSGGLIITKVPKKEGSQNYISDHEEDEEEEERERSRRTRTKITYEEGDVDILEHAIGEITAPEDKKNSDAKEMKKSDSVSTDSSVVLSDNEDDNESNADNLKGDGDQESSENGVKSFQLLSGGKKLDVVMLFDN